MTDVERYKKLKLELEDVAGKLVGLPQRVDLLKREVATARDAAVRGEYMGDPEAARRHETIKSAQGEIQRIEAERDDLLHRRGILQDLLEEVRKKAEAELVPIHAHKFEKALKVFASLLRSAHKAELELAEVREEAARSFGEIDSRQVPLQSWTPIVMRDAGSPGIMRPEVERFLDQMKGAGFDLS